MPKTYNTTNRPCGAVGVEEINGLVQNAKGLVVRNAKWAVYKCQRKCGAKL